MTWEPKNKLDDEDVDVSDDEEGEGGFVSDFGLNNTLIYRANGNFSNLLLGNSGKNYLSECHLGDDGQHDLFSLRWVWVLLVFIEPSFQGCC